MEKKDKYENDGHPEAITKDDEVISHDIIITSPRSSQSPSLINLDTNSEVRFYFHLYFFIFCISPRDKIDLFCKIPTVFIFLMPEIFKVRIFVYIKRALINLYLSPLQIPEIDAHFLSI